MPTALQPKLPWKQPLSILKMLPFPSVKVRNVFIKLKGSLIVPPIYMKLCNKPKQFSKRQGLMAFLGWQKWKLERAQKEEKHQVEREFEGLERWLKS